MEKPPANVVVELLLLIFAAAVGGFILIDQPDPFFQQSTERAIGVVGAWFQVVGAILVSFEFLRGPLAKRQLEDYEAIKAEQSERFHKEILPQKNTEDGPKLIQEHMSFNQRLDKVYKPVRFFPITVRQVYGLGLIFICSGYILQLSVA